MKKLKDPDPSTKNFFAVVVDRLETKLGPVLFQLPPGWVVNVERLATFLESLPLGYKYVFEFRDESWLTRKVFEVLHHYNAALCIHDLGNMKTPVEITTDFTYVRFHGPGGAKYTAPIRTKSWSSEPTESNPGLETCLRFMSTSIMTWVVGQ